MDLTEAYLGEHPLRYERFPGAKPGPGAKNRGECAKKQKPMLVRACRRMDEIIKPQKPGKEYEQIVAAIHRQFAGDAQVTENEIIRGRTGQRRQIDVAIRTNVNGAYPILVVVECKDYKDPVGIDKVDELIGKIDDVEAAMGVLVSNSGFTKDAELRAAAQDAHVQLASVVDVENEKIRTRVAIPVICDYRAPEFQVSIAGSAKKQFTVDATFMTDLKRRFLEKWNNGQLNDHLGDHQYTELVRDEPELTVSVTYDYRVKRRLFYGQVKLVQAKGILNVTKGTFRTTGFTKEPINAEDVETNWQRVDEGETPFAVITLTALDVFPLPEAPSR